MIGYRYWDVIRDDVFDYLLVSPTMKTIWHPDGVGGPVDEIWNHHQEYFLEGSLVDADTAALAPDRVIDMANGDVPVLEVGYSAYHEREDIFDLYADEIPTIAGVVSGWGKRHVGDDSFFCEYMKPLAFLFQDWETIRLRSLEHSQIGRAHV